MSTRCQTTSRQAKAWYLHHTLNWELDRIGRWLGIKPPAVSRLIERARRKKDPVHSLGNPPSRRVRPLQLSAVIDV